MSIIYIYMIDISYLLCASCYFIVKWYPLVIMLCSCLHMALQWPTKLKKISITWLANDSSWCKIVWHLLFVTIWNIPRIGLAIAILTLCHNQKIPRGGLRGYITSFFLWLAALASSCRVIYLVLALDLTITIARTTSFSKWSLKAYMVKFLNNRNLRISRIYLQNPCRDSRVMYKLL